MAFVTWGGNYCIAQETAYKTLSFPDGNSKRVQSYTDTWSATISGFTWEIVKFNNNNSGWKFIRAGSKKNASVATIKNETPFDRAIGKVVVDIAEIENTQIKNINSIKFEVSSDGFQTIDQTNTITSDFNNVEKHTFVVSNPRVGQYFRLTFDLKKGGSNGFVQVNKVEYYEDASNKTATSLSFDAPSYEISKDQTLQQLPTLKAGEQTLSDKTITWSSDNKDVATVDANGTVTGVGLGKANITAKFAGDDTYKTSTASYEIKVKGAPELSFPEPSYNIIANEPFAAPKLTKSPADVVVTYSSSDEKVATVEPSTGEVSIVGAGTAKITATSQVTDVYEVASASYDLVVTKFTPALSFPQTSYTIKMGDAFAPKLEGLPEGVTPAYTSSKEDVAAVDAATGEVKIVGVGTTTITVTSPETGIYEGATTSYELNVKAGIYKVEFDFTNNNWGLPTTNYKKEESSYTNGAGYTITFGKSNGGHKIMGTDPNRNLIFGKEGATLSLPAFPFAVSKIKVFGRTNASSKVTQNIFVGEEAVSTETTNATTDHIYEIKEAFQAAGNIYTLKVTNDNNTQITKIVVYAKDETVAGAINIATEEGFGTFYTNKNYVLPQGLTAFGYTSIDGNNTLTKSIEYVAGDIVPANTAVVVKGAKGSYNYYNTEEAATKTIEKNLLKGVTTDTKIEATSGVKRYILTRADDGILAFYRTNTGNINVKANRAYLEVPTAMAVASFSLEGSATGINNVVTTAAKQGIYTISGVRLNATTTKELPAGIYIVNGKKVIVK